MSIDLEREGISIIAIYGVHFDVYAKLFSEKSLPKKCAIVTDGDLKPDDADPSLEGEDDLPASPDLRALEGSHVRVLPAPPRSSVPSHWRERLQMFARAADDIGASTVAARLRAAAGAR